LSPSLLKSAVEGEFGLNKKGPDDVGYFLFLVSSSRYAQLSAPKALSAEDEYGLWREGSPKGDIDRRLRDLEEERRIERDDDDDVDDEVSLAFGAKPHFTFKSASSALALEGRPIDAG